MQTLHYAFALGSQVRLPSGEVGTVASLIFGLVAKEYLVRAASGVHWHAEQALVDLNPGSGLRPSKGGRDDQADD